MSQYREHPDIQEKPRGGIERALDAHLGQAAANPDYHYRKAGQVSRILAGLMGAGGGAIGGGFLSGLLGAGNTGRIVSRIGGGLVGGAGLGALTHWLAKRRAKNQLLRAKSKGFSINKKYVTHKKLKSILD